MQDLHGLPGHRVDVPGPVDLAVIAVPADAVARVSRGRARPRACAALVVISAGFAETGAARRDASRPSSSTSAAHGGHAPGRPQLPGRAQHRPGRRPRTRRSRPVRPPAGQRRLPRPRAARSASRCIERGPRARHRPVRRSSRSATRPTSPATTCCSTGRSDADTDVVLLYLESFGNPRRFARIARARRAHASRSSPSRAAARAAGAAAPRSHTGALVAASDVAVDALFAQAGVIRADTLDELFDIARAARQPAAAPRRTRRHRDQRRRPGDPVRRRLRGGRPRSAALSDATRARARPHAARRGTTVNPVDMIASATAEHYGNVLDALASSGEVDALIAIFVRPLGTRGAEVQRAIEAAAAPHAELPFLSVSDRPTRMRPAPRAPCRSSPSPRRRPAPSRMPPVTRVARTPARRRARAGRRRPHPCCRRGGVRPRPRAALAERRRGRRGSRTATACRGSRSREAQTPDAVAAIAAELGGPVALKAIAPGLVHKTDAGGVRVGLRGPSEARAARRRSPPRSRRTAIRGRASWFSPWPSRGRDARRNRWCRRTSGPSWPVAPAAPSRRSGATSPSDSRP